MIYVDFINKLLQERIYQADNIVLFGQNISTGSCLGGLTRNLKVRNKCRILNTQNSENTLVGVGFGLMLNGVSSIFFMKQLDFLLLGVDHLVNTYNFIRITQPKASFTIMPIVVDLGFQGLQSSFNSFTDICSIARVNGYTITNTYDAEKIIDSQLINPGFRIIGVSQRLFKQEAINFKDILFSNHDLTLFKYASGDQVTIVCFNFSFSQGWELCEILKAADLTASLFSVNLTTPIDWDPIIRDVMRTRKMIIIDDSKTQNMSCYSLTSEVLTKVRLDHLEIIDRKFSDKCYYPNSEELALDYNAIIVRMMAKNGAGKFLY